MANHKGAAVTDRNDNGKRKNKYTNNREEIANEWMIKKGTPEEGERSGISLHKQ
ncbi:MULTISPECIES: hypothetical protein [Geobacillus]|nr:MULTISPECIES: hypothetical protein [Geobacillus]KPD00778.1 hypothetical protein LR69_00860 [Geobacillus sp. BCO2]